MKSISFLHFRSEYFNNSITKLESNTSKRKKQHRKKYFSPTSSDPIKEFHSLPDLEFRTMEIIIWFSNNKHSIYFTQDWLAKKLKVTRQTTNEVLKSLSRRGYISWEYRHMKSCLYKLSDYFLWMPIRQKLASLIPAFKYVSLSVITGSILHFERKFLFNPTQVNYPLDYYIYLAKKNSHKLHNQPIRKRIADQNWHSLSKKNKKGITNMNNPPQNDILEFMNLTELGYARLSCFPEAAFGWAATRMASVKGIKDHFVYFHKLCKIYCEEKRLPIDWTLYSSIVSKNSLDPSGPLTNGPLLVDKLPRSPSPSISQKREGGRNDAKDQEIYSRFLAKRKAQVQSLPPPSEEIMRSMSGFFDGSKEHLELLISQHSKEALTKKQPQLLSSVIDNLSAPANHRQTVDSSPLPDYNDTNYSNEDDPPSNIWEFAL